MLHFELSLHLFRGAEDRAVRMFEEGAVFDRDGGVRDESEEDSRHSKDRQGA